MVSFIEANERNFQLNLIRKSACVDEVESHFIDEIVRNVECSAYWFMAKCNSLELLNILKFIPFDKVFVNVQLLCALASFYIAETMVVIIPYRILSIFAANCIEYVNWVAHFAFARVHFDACLVCGLLESKACDDGNKIITLLMQAWVNRNIAFYSHLSAHIAYVSRWECASVFFSLADALTKRTDNGNEFQPTSLNSNIHNE